MCQETLERASQPKKKPYISPRNSCSDAITRHSISHPVWTLRIGKDIPSLLMWRCHCEATAWRVTIPSPWNMSLCSLFHPTLMLFSIFDSTVSTLGLSRTPLWSAVLMKISQEILLNIPSQLLCHKHWSRGKCPSADSGKHPYAVRTESFSCLCILNIWECLPPQQFQVFLVNQMRFSASHKTQKFIKAEEEGFAGYFESFYLVQQHAMESEDCLLSCSSYMTIKQRKKPQWRISKWLYHFNINNFNTIILAFWKSLILKKQDYPAYR